MKKLPLMAAAALALVASPVLMAATTAPASAQEWRDRDGDFTEGELREFLRDALEARGDRREALGDRLRDRRDRRSELLDMIRERRDRRDELMDHLGDRGGPRGRLRERIAERRGGDDDGSCYFLTRTLRSEDGDTLVMVRRRVCRD